MRIYRFITIAALLVATQFSAYAGEIAVLKNGFSIHFERKEQTGNLIRLYTGSGYMEIASDQIESYEAQEVSPVPDTPEHAKVGSAKAQTSTTQPVPAVQQTAAPIVAAAPKALEP